MHKTLIVLLVTSVQNQNQNNPTNQQQKALLSVQIHANVKCIILPSQTQNHCTSLIKQ